MTAHDATQEELFKPPDIKPHLRMWRYQWIGIPLILIIPILAMLGVFGIEIEKLNISTSGVETSIEYPAKMRYGQEEFIRMEFKNVSGETIQDLAVSFDQDYIRKFDGIDFNPQLETNYIVKTGVIPPGETGTVNVKLKAGEYGSHSGEIKISSQNKEIISEELSTFIFP